MKKDFDEIDLKIINELQKDARISVNQLSKLVNLTSPAVARRIANLEESGVITGYKATVDPSKLGLAVTGYIILSIKKIELKKFINHIENIKEVVSCETIIAGGQELILKIACTDNHSLMALYEKLPYSYIEDMTALLTLSPPDKDGIYDAE